MPFNDQFFKDFRLAGFFLAVFEQPWDAPCLALNLRQCSVGDLLLFVRISQRELAVDLFQLRRKCFLRVGNIRPGIGERIGNVAVVGFECRFDSVGMIISRRLHLI